MTARHVPLEGGYNLRDLGGYLGTDGRAVRRGCLYRSGQLCRLSGADLDAVRDLGIKVVFDLRNEAERSAYPSRIPVGIEVRERTSPGSDGTDIRTWEELIAAGDIPVRDDELMAGVYIGLLDRLAPEFREILVLAVSARDRPLLFHCAAGKDRTGLTAALVLGLLGVAEDDVLDDYELTSVYFGEPRLAELSPMLDTYGISPERVRPLLYARRTVLLRAIEHVQLQWGGFEGYAHDRLGVDPALPERLQANLLV